jgi:hypothetical protein
MKKIFTLAAAVLASLSLTWADPTVEILNSNFTQWATTPPENSGLSNKNTYTITDGVSDVATVVGSGCKLNDTKNEIRMKKQEFAAISSGYSAMVNAKNIMNGNYQQNEMYDSAIESLTNDLHVKIAEMDNFMQLSQPLFDDLDLQNETYKLEGAQLYEKIMTEGKAFLDKIDYGKDSYLPSNQ